MFVTQSMQDMSNEDAQEYFFGNFFIKDRLVRDMDGNIAPTNIVDWAIEKGCKIDVDLDFQAYQREYESF